MSVKCSEEHGELAEEALDDYALYEEKLKEAEAMLVACKKITGKFPADKGKHHLATKAQAKGKKPLTAT